MVSEARSIEEVRRRNFDRDAREMEAFAENYFVQATLARDAGQEEEATLLASVALDIKGIAMGIATLPHTRALTGREGH